MLAVAYLAVQLAWAAVTPLPPLPHAQALHAPTAAQAGNAPAFDAAALTRLNPFARDQAGQPDGPAAENAPETALDLALYGVRADARSGAGAAIIRLPDGRQQAFSRGDSVVDGVTLDRVLADRVLLGRSGGRRESLYLDPEARREARGPNAATLGNRAQMQAAGDDGSKRVNIENADVLLRRIRLTPRLEAGRINGVKVAPQGGGAELFRRAGFQPGDVMTRINGLPLSGPGAIGALGRRLRGADEVRIDVERDGQPRSIRLRFE